MKTIHHPNNAFSAARDASSRKASDAGAVFPVLELVIFACAFGVTGALAAFILS
ncbi:hypothetical protein Q5Y75_02470 [Ruegeria sp. 2205SS24-7]|uniref:hypothetical protein n=1 Tax=Ruegeria discodermiae TaxID=3064389 RepID=UPI0027405381|nr:hypothetical protein [Ruegeria sp. 2205SS24-7]MDP5216073.1 hypothetical protein [Ruegeria sp. 2205SS24-7]